MSWKPRVATVDMVDSCTAIPQFFARRLRRPSLFCLYNPPLLESIYHYIYPPWTYGYLWRHIRWPPHPCPLSHSNGVRMNSFRAPSRRPTGTWKAATTRLWSNKSIVLRAEITQQEQTQLGSATLQHEMAGDTCQILPMSIPRRPMRLPNLVRSGGKRAHCGPHCQDGAWLFFVTLRAFSQVGETEDIGNHRPSDNQIRYDPPESGAANPDSTPFSALKTAAQGHLGLRNSRNP